LRRAGQTGICSQAHLFGADFVLDSEVTMATSNGNRPSVLFGDFELNLQLGVLRKNGIRLRCQEQPLQVLATLIERPGELVTREELRRRVWSHDTFVDFDHALNTAVKKIRATLNDDADAPRYIETVPRRGYRFVGKIEQSAPQGPAILAVPAQAPSAPSAQRRNRTWLFALGGSLVAFIAVFGWTVAGWHHSEASIAPEFQRLTFDQPELGEARFTPDGASVVYSAEGLPHEENIFVERLGTPSAEPIATKNSTLLAISRQGEMAILRKGVDSDFVVPFRLETGTLARVSLAGNAPRELMSNVERADWSPDGQLAIVRRVGHKSRLEFPVGKVLYENSGWIDSPRFSPRGDAIAFLSHPVFPDDRGSVAIVDLPSGKRKMLSAYWESMRGLAWSPHGDEVWFGAARSGVSRALYAVDLNGHERRVMSIAGGVSLRDVAPDGRVLLTRDNERIGMLLMGPGDQQPRELSWKDWSIAMDISRDGKLLLFGAEGEDSGFSYQVGLRPTDGSPPVILGPGAAQSLSPDGKWALSIMPPPDDQIVLLPTGAGTSKPLERGPVEHYQFASARWFEDSKQIIFVGYERDHGPRCYTQSVDGGSPKPFSPEGVVFCSPAPTGAILALTEDHHGKLYPSAQSNQPEKEFQMDVNDWPIGWSPDAKFLYLASTGQMPVTITRFELATGRGQTWKRIEGPPSPGRMTLKCKDVVLSADGRFYAYTYTYHASDLYLVQGLK
jgi:eukaryotic-like serine/threonine-protein kinase